MNKLVLRGASAVLFRRCAINLNHTRKALPLMSSVRYFSTVSMGQAVNNFYARGEAEEITVASISKTMGDILKSHISFGEH